MHQFKFDGDVNGVSEKQLDFMCSVLEKRGYKDETVTIEPVGKAEDNYGAKVKRITVKKDGETFKMIAKIALTIEMFRNATPVAVFFTNEQVIYTKVLPKFCELENEAGVPENERLRVPLCYGTMIEAPNEIILLEDLQEHNFGILDKNKSLADDCVKSALKQLAKFHALSYVLKNRDPEKFTALSNELFNPFIVLTQSPALMTFFSQIEQQILALTDDEHKTLVKNTLSQLPENIVTNLKQDKQSKFSVIQQGDAWTNNLLFKMENEKPVECCIIDYQQCNENNPALDLHYMIFNCTDYKARSKHYHQWIDCYHSELSSYLDNFGLKTNLIYPKDQLEADLKRLSKVGFAYGLIMAITITRNTQQAAELKDALENGMSMADMVALMSSSAVQYSSTGRLKVKLDELIKSFTSWDMFDDIMVSIK